MEVGKSKKRTNLNLVLKMALQLEEIRKKINSNEKSGVLLKAKFQQNRLKFHAQKRLSNDFTLSELNQSTADFFAFVQNLLPTDKFKLFKELFRYPVVTNEITDIIFDRLSRIFDGQNPAFDYQFLDSKDKDDWEWYRQTILGEPNVWATRGFEYYKTEINSFLVVDLPVLQVSERPEPYFYWLPICHVITWESDKNGNLKYLIFKQKDKKVAVVDDESYRIFEEDKSGNIGELLVESKHSLGYCPACFFINEPLSLDDKDVKLSPLTKVLGSLDWFLFYHISKQQLDLSGSYPIYSGYEQNCDFVNTETGDFCDGGFLRDKAGRYKFDASGVLCNCPKCSSKRIVGPGSFVEIPVPDGDKQPDLRNPIQILSVDKDSLEYNVTEENRLREKIITSVVGYSTNVVNSEAVNETQVKADFEDATTILNRVKKTFEVAQKFVDDTICRLRYGESFISSNVNYGTKFYLYTSVQLREQYQKAKNAGASESELDALQGQIIETEYRNNPIQKQRMIELFALEPYRHLTRSEVLDLYDKGLVSKEELMVKLNFSTLIDKFERENINLLEFGTAIPFARKIKIVSDKLLEYAREKINKTNINNQIIK